MNICLNDRIPPVAWREVRSMMRGNRAPLMLFACTAVSVGVALFALQANLSKPLMSPEEMARVGSLIFHWLLLMEGVIVLGLTPLLTAGAISGERQRQTLESLLLTRLSPQEIITGKLFVALGFIAVVQCCVLPVIAIIGLLGGVSPWELLLSQGLLLASAAAIGAIGLAYSARCRSMAVPYLLTYVTVFLLFGPLLPLTALAPWVVSRRRWTEEIQGYLSLVLILSFLAMPVLVQWPILFSAPMLASPAYALACLMQESLPLATVWWLSMALATAIMVALARNMLRRAADTLAPAHVDLPYSWPERLRSRRRGAERVLMRQPAMVGQQDMVPGKRKEQEGAEVQAQ